MTPPEFDRCLEKPKNNPGTAQATVRINECRQLHCNWHELAQTTFLFPCACVGKTGNSIHTSVGCWRLASYHGRTADSESLHVTFQQIVAWISAHSSVNDVHAATLNMIFRVVQSHSLVVLVGVPEQEYQERVQQYRLVVPGCEMHGKQTRGGSSKLNG